MAHIGNPPKKTKFFEYKLILYHPEEFLPIVREDIDYHEDSVDFIRYLRMLSSSDFNGSYLLHKEEDAYFYKLHISEDIDMMSYLKGKYG